MHADAGRFGTVLLLCLIMVSLASATWQGLDEGFRVEFSSADSIRLSWGGNVTNEPYLRHLQREIPTVDELRATCLIAVPRGKMAYVSRTTNFASGSVTLSQPVCMRDLWMSAIDILLDSQMYASGHVSRGTITIRFENSDAAPTPLTRGVSGVFYPLYTALTPNFLDVTPTANQLLVPTILVISPSAYITGMSEWIAWRKSMGWKVIVTDLTVIGNSSTALQSYIQTAYLTWTTPPDAVYLIGEETRVATATSWTDDPGTFYSSGSGGQPYPGYYLDEQSYTRFDGPNWYNLPDPMPDILLGRMPANSITQVRSQCTNLHNYEARSDTLAWSNQAICGADQETPTQVETIRWSRQRMLEAGLSNVDTLFTATSGQFINSYLSSGRALINYRGQGWSNGWAGIDYTSFDIPSVNNLNRMVVITGIGCGVAKFDAQNCFGELWMQRGTNLGAVGFVGPTFNTHTQYNNQIDIGLYRFWFRNKFNGLTLGLMAGKAQMFSSFSANIVNDPNIREILRLECNEYTTLSDPVLNVMAGVPKQLTVSVPQNFDLGYQTVTFSVRNTVNQLPHPNLMVVLYDTTGPLGMGWTDSAGHATVSADLGTDNRYIYYAISGYQARAKIDSFLVPSTNYSIQFDSIRVLNTAGNIFPSDTLRLNLYLHNRMATPVSNVRIVLHTPDTNLVILDSVRQIPSIIANESVTMSDYAIVIPSNYHRTSIVAAFSAYTQTQYAGERQFAIPISIPSVSIFNVGFDTSGNRRLDRGETTTFIFSVNNDGVVDLPNLEIYTSCRDSLVTFIPDTFRVALQRNSYSTFVNVVRSASNLPAYYPLHMNMVVRQRFTNFTFTDTIKMSFECGSLDTLAPSHVSEMPYYAYESSDTIYRAAPDPTWIELAPSRGGNGNIIPFTAGNAVSMLQVPFVFRYFGNTYSNVVVCTDGWLAPSNADTVVSRSSNDTLPNRHNPWNVIAPYWDNLWFPGMPNQAVYWTIDSLNRLIVQWDSLVVVATPDIRVSFEAIIYDSEMSPTSTGDSRIMFSYRSVPIGETCLATVGIEAPSNQSGMTLLYNQYFSKTIHPNWNFPYSILFTTNPPSIGERVPDAVSETVVRVPRGFELIGPYPNPFNPETNLIVDLPNRVPLRVDLYNVQGRLVQNIRSGIASAGRQLITIRGNELPSGVYFVQVVAGSSRETRKLLLIR